jgi:hypothetical protein
MVFDSADIGMEWQRELRLAGWWEEYGVQR